MEGATHWSIKCQGATRTTGAPFVFMLMLQNGQLPRSLFHRPIHQIPPPLLPPLDGRDASNYLRFGPN